MKIFKLIDKPDLILRIYQLYNEAFSESWSAFKLFWKEIDLNHSFLGVIDGELACMCLNSIKQIKIKDVVYNCLSLSAVSVKSKLQNQRLSKQLLNYVVEQCSPHFDCLLLQAENWKYYEHLNFLTATTDCLCDYYPALKLKNGSGLCGITKNQWIDFAKLYQLFQLDQQRRCSSLLWSLTTFKNFCLYKLANNEILYYSNKAFCFLENDTITAYGFISPFDFMNLMEQIDNCEKLVFELGKSEMQLLLNYGANLILVSERIGIKTNQSFFPNDCEIYLWNRFV